MRHSRVRQDVGVPEPPYIDDSQAKLVRQGAVRRHDDAQELRVPNSEITFIRIDHQTRLQFGETEVVIETPFELRVGNVTHHLDPKRRDELGPLLALYPDTLDDAIVEPSACLILQFTSGACVTVPQDPDYEAWQVSGPHYLVVCMPATDGSIAISD